MPTALHKGPYRFYFWSHEPHEPPHVHVEEGNNVVKYWLEPVRCARNYGFAAHKLTQIQSLVEQHRVKLLRKWDDHFSGR
jgi:Domain of unknown function (DUF4160)